MRRSILAQAVASAFLLFAGVTHASPIQTPIAVTGFNQDVIVETGAANFTGSVTATYDGGVGGAAAGQNTFYQVGQDASNPTTGLPAGSSFVSAADANTTYLLQSAVGNNAFFLDGHNGSVTATATLTTPRAFSNLSFLTSSGNTQSAPVSVTATLQFASGPNDTVTFSSPDWFNGSNTAINASGRVSNNGTNGFQYDSVGSSNPRLYQEDVTLSTADQSRILTGIVFTGNDTGTTTTGILAISGTSVPEPASFGLSLLGAVALMIRRRRA